jgi:hypothetical protein
VELDELKTGECARFLQRPANLLERAQRARREHEAAEAALAAAKAPAVGGAANPGAYEGFAPGASNLPIQSPCIFSHKSRDGTTLKSDQSISGFPRPARPPKRP